MIELILIVGAVYLATIVFDPNHPFNKKRDDK